MSILLAAASALIVGLPAAGDRPRAVTFTATVIPMNEIAVTVVGDIAIADATVFGQRYRRAFVVDEHSVITASAEGLRIDDETALVSR